MSYLDDDFYDRLIEYASTLGISQEPDYDELKHYGMPKRSGRYPYGSGDEPFQHANDFLGRINELKKTNFTYTDSEGKTYSGENAIAKSMGLTTKEYRIQKSAAKDEQRALTIDTIKRLQEKEGLSNTEIGRKLGLNESSVRSLLNEKAEARMNVAKDTANFIKEQVDKKGMIDVTSGVERELGVSREKLNEALYLLEKEGYPTYKGGIPQATNPGKQTNQRVICPPGTDHKEIYNFENVHSMKDYVSRDGGDSFQKKFTYPESLDSSRMRVRYAEEGGLQKDGVVELRRGVDDLSLGESKYSQVRIMVDGKHYIKGMAVYSDDLPPGVDVLFNTNKKKGTPLEKVLKPIKDDPDNPFGSTIKDADQGGQYWYTGKDGKQKLGLINKRSDQGDWSEWADAVPSQFLSKQSLSMAKKQITKSVQSKQEEFDEIMSLTNPTIKKHLLNKFADECDSTAVHLKAAALPGQRYHVILPLTKIKDTEVFAPNYEDGTKLALVRYPHGGTFEIPILTVNNKLQEGRRVIGLKSEDAIGINSKVAERLSGADFDGDTVMAIPTHDASGKIRITSTPPLKGLEGFDPKLEYPERPGMKYMKDPVTGKDATQLEMGKISNLITDMTLGGADQKELAAAVRHSMVVIDAAKHKLDYRKSAVDNNISQLRKTYQMSVNPDTGKIKYGGASTLISRAKGEQQVLKRQGSPKVNMKGTDDYDPSKPEGSLIYKTADDVSWTTTRVDKRTGDTVTDTHYKHQKSSKMAEVDDAYELISAKKYPMEIAYADYANKMKSMANSARKEMMLTGNLEYSSTAKKEYAQEVSSLMSKLNRAELNKPKERQAQRLANAEVSAKIKELNNPSNGEIKKLKQQALSKYRMEVGSESRSERSIKVTDKEWEAIQKGAISENTLKKILTNADVDSLRERATPREKKQITSAQASRIQALSNSNYSLSEIASKLGISTSTVTKYLKGGN